MFVVIVVVHIVLCVCLMGLVLLQQGKGADAGAIMGGGADSLMGAGGASTIISKATTSLAIGFMITSIILVKFYDQAMVVRASGSDLLKGSVMEAVTPPAVDPAESLPVPVEGAADASKTDSAELPAKVSSATAETDVDVKTEKSETAEEKTEENVNADAGTTEENVVSQ